MSLSQEMHNELMTSLLHRYTHISVYFLFFVVGYTTASLVIHSTLFYRFTSLKHLYYSLDRSVHQLHTHHAPT